MVPKQKPKNTHTHRQTNSEKYSFLKFFFVEKTTKLIQTNIHTQIHLYSMKNFFCYENSPVSGGIK